MVIIYYSGKRLSEIQTKPCLAWFIARDTVPHTTAHRYMGFTYKDIDKIRSDPKQSRILKRLGEIEEGNSTIN